MNDLVVLAASAVVVALLSVIALAMGFRAAVTFETPEAVGAAVRAVYPDAQIADVAFDKRAAIARLADGRWAIARAVGDGVAVRIVGDARLRPAVRQRRDDVIVRTPGLDVGFPAARLRLTALPDWLDALARRG